MVNLDSAYFVGSVHGNLTSLGAELRCTIRSSHQRRTLEYVVKLCLLMGNVDRITEVLSVILTLRYTRCGKARVQVIL